METLSALIQQYGYLAVFVGAFLEGETILALAGFAAQRGQLDFPAVILIGFIGGFLGDQFFFHLGRRNGMLILSRFPSMARHLATVDDLLSRYHGPLIFGIRFMYGLRIAGPIALGMGPVSARKFLIFNLLGAIVWAIVVAGAGYLFGASLETALQELGRYELLGLAVLALIVVGLWLRLRSQRK